MSLLVAALVLPVLHTVDLVPRGATVAPIEITLPRDQWLDLKVTLVVPANEPDIDGLEIMAENLMTGYWDHRQPPNLFVTISRLDAEGHPHPARARVKTSGGGQELREHFKDVMIELLDTPENREQRMRDYLAKTVPPEQHISADAFIRSFDRLYIANPPGRYRLEFEYRGAGGAYAHRSVLVQVNDGPDTLDDLAAKR